MSQCTDHNDLAVATFLAGVDFNSINERTDVFNSLRASRLIIQHLLQLATFRAVEVREIGMDSDLKIALLRLQIDSISRLRASKRRN